jgi:propionyl-CoA synthetase
MENDYDSVYGRWLSNPEIFWAEAAEAVQWFKKWDRVLDASRPPFYRWFSGGIVNSCYNALDLHVETGRADWPALIYDSPVTNSTQVYTYRALLDEVARFAGVLLRQGVQKGDRVIIYMPMVTEAAIVRWASLF